MRVRLRCPVSPPEWALLERLLIDTMCRAAREFVERYCRQDGTLVWRDEWPGMDGSDDGYESFANFPLLASIAGDRDLDSLARRQWEAVTRQFTGYGQVWREFDGYYDWMHHGESSLLLYYLGLTGPAEPRWVGRARRFAAMYTGSDPEAPNWDPDRRMIRSPINGSRGPRFENSAEDWVTHRPVLAHYPPPFEDLPGAVPGQPANWNDDAVFAEILRRMNERMMQGDVPLNLTATSLVAHAYLHTGEPAYSEWVADYVRAWTERADANGGVLPDNVGPSGQVGECFDGKWWGGYYGWRWPHGFLNLIQPALIGAANALLLTGDREHLALPRRLLDAVWGARRREGGVARTPHRHGDSGWYDFRAPDPQWAIHLWNLSQEPEDAERVETWRGRADPGHVAAGRGKGDDLHTLPWFAWARDRLPEYPSAILRTNLAEVQRRLDAMRHDDGDPEQWDVHHWQDLNPVVCEGLVQLTMGAPNAIYHGGLLHARLRTFDHETGWTGLPQGVGALVSSVDDTGFTLDLVNLDLLRSKRVALHAGLFGEHRFRDVNAGDGPVPLDGAEPLSVEIGPGCGGQLRLSVDRYANAPSYAWPI